jgi:murein DD-endopeptidase MepM/ murein hydrolase activator NlpD
MARRSKVSRFFVRILILGALAGVGFLGVAAFRAGPAPQIVMEADLPGIGKNTPVHVIFTENKRGLRNIRVELIQGDRVEVLEERSYEPLQPWEFWGERVKQEALHLAVGSETVKDLREGEATIRATADHAGAWLRRPDPAVDELLLKVQLRPPALQVLSTRTYVSQGGSEAVVYSVGKTAVRDGVMAGEWWFPGYPIAGGDGQQRFALFSAPWDNSDPSAIKLVASDDVGNQSVVSFVDRFNPAPVKTDTIRVSDDFMSRVVPAIMSQLPELEDRGNLLDNYLMINGELRERNSQTINELAAASLPEFFWSRPFMQMRNAQVMSDFADRRTYLYNGQPVDEQVHLGFDLASTQRAEIPAANDGIVVLARFFGIYGNAVIIDHGYGLMSLYGHLSTISVEQGQQVERGQTIGRTGVTGLAGGDHLHFTMLLQGLPVNPREWWDAHWIHDRLKLKLESTLPFE